MVPKRVPSVLKKRYLRLVRRSYRHLRKPRWHRQKWWKVFSARLFDRPLWKPCRHTVASGISIGVFFSMMPMPMQMVASALVAMRLRVNIPFAMLACWVSNPLTEPFIRIWQEKFGGWLRESVGMPIPPMLQNVKWTFANITFDLGNFVLGFLASGLLLGLIAYPLVQLVSTLIPHYLPAPPIPSRRRKPRENPPK
jgi:uncharacterized protein (DUF2062 family)